MVLMCGAAQCALGTTISEAKLLPDGGHPSLLSKVVTYAAPDFFYIEEDDQTSGIRVERAAHGFVVGARVNVSGTLGTNANGERSLLNC